VGYEFRQLVGGRWCDALGGGSWDVLNPATEQVVRTVPYGAGEDCRAALEAAHEAQPAWARKTAYERAAILKAAAELMRARAPELGRFTTLESGKPLVQGVGEWTVAADLFEWFAEEGKRAYGRVVPSRNAAKRTLVLKQPVGVVGIITAWNFPVYNVARAGAAALAAGCAIVIRPSEYTPLSAMLIANLLHEAGAPAGVVNLINGDPASMGQAMLEDARCRKIHFTGSQRVGKLLMDGASKTVTRLSLELGGNAPVLIFPDVDVAAVAASSVAAKFRNCGQVCIAPQRFLVHTSIAQQFVECAAKHVQSLTLGNGLDAVTNVGPMINAPQRDRLATLVAAETGSVIAGGRKPERAGYFYEPTLIADVATDSALYNQEIFGPVLPVASFDDAGQAIAYANAGEFGLAAYVWTNNLKTAIHTYEALEYGMIGVNEWTPQATEAPFAGVKSSGIGQEAGSEGLAEYLETKLVALGGLG
jgi:acyl-CoA reductase-like NAD-dependent aldehyde dehydrogenase